MIKEKAKTRKDLELEIDALKKRNEELSKIQTSQPKVSVDTNKYMKELQNIRRKGRVESNTIKVQEFSDHKNISLWTKWGKRVGPLHPHNAQDALARFWDMGVELSTDQPTKEQIKGFWDSAEGIKRKKDQDARRVVRMKSKKSGVVEKYLETIAAQTGQGIQHLTQILQPGEAKMPTGAR